VIGHNDAAPYNAVWGGDGLVGFVDWDMSGPVAREADVAWMVFSWVPLHARVVVGSEGFTDFSARRRRLELFLREYGAGACGTVGAGRAGGDGDNLTADGLLEILRLRLPEKIEAIRLAAVAGDTTYQQLLDHGADLLLVQALQGLDEV
jgi:hypothetical protein